MTIKYDPNGKFPNVAAERLLELGGWVNDWIMAGDMHDEFIDIFNANYCTPVDPNNLLTVQGTLDADGTYHYPGDPPLNPAYMLTRGNEVLYVYQHALFAVRNTTTEDWYMVRMD